MIEKILTDLAMIVFVLFCVHVIYREVCITKKPINYPAIKPWELNDYNR